MNCIPSYRHEKIGYERTKNFIFEVLMLFGHLCNTCEEVGIGKRLPRACISFAFKYVPCIFDCRYGSTAENNSENLTPRSGSSRSEITLTFEELMFSEFKILLIP
jgi:hypothetical protein|tara:strand:- start:509 stop:823 length:315 start_codon:yes stop_codon:yes gene_type:complete